MVVLGWTAVAFAVATGGFIDRATGPPQPVGVTRWNPGEYAPNQLASLLEAVAPRVPAGRLVLIHADRAPAEEQYFLSLWAAYHLPRHRVVRAGHPAAATGDHLVVFSPGHRPPPPEPQWQPVLEHPAGALYRRPAGDR